MTEKSCGKCKHFSPTRGETGRPLPSKPGRCAYTVPVPPLPFSVTEYARQSRFYGYFQKVNVYAHDGKTCQTFDPVKPVKPAKPVQKAIEL